MKSVVCSDKNSCKPFPKLMKGNEDLIVLMSSHGCGTVVSSGKTKHELGYVGNAWAMYVFSDFTGTVTLSND